MDHIESAPVSQNASIEIPCLSHEPYDGEDFPKYPERAGWDIDRLLAGDFSQHPAEPTGAFLQNWLYFGVLWEVFGPITRGAKNNYVMPQEGTMYGIITIAALDVQIIQLLSSITSMMQAGDVIPAQMIAHRIITCLTTVSRFCRLATCAGDPRPGFKIWPLSPEIDLSIRALGHRLAWNFPVGALDMAMSSSTGGLQFPCAWFPQARMKQMGCCPSEIAMVEKTFTSASAYYASQMERPPSAVQRDHGKCTGKLCFARQINEATYRTAHTTAECDCQHLGPSIDEVVSIIASGGVPLMSITPMKKEPYLKVEVQKYSGTKRYVALSHVWSDGMGNPTANTLPMCQMLRIRALLDELLSGISYADLVNRLAFGDLFKKKFQGSSISFWMDTLCIPVAPEHKELRSKSIKGMKAVYERAFRVLVLDSDIQQCSMKDYTQSFMRIQMSAWMRRLWTLNEGVLANRLCVKYADGILDVQVASEEYQEKVKNSGMANYMDSYGTPMRDADSFGWKFRLLRRNVLRDPDPRLVHSDRYSDKEIASPEQKRCYAIMEAFSVSLHRTTTKMADEMLCFASLIGWDTFLLKGIPFEDHLHVFLSTESQLPQGMLFLAGPRMRQPGWRWAVNRFGDNGAMRLNAKFDDMTPGIVSENGFIVEFPGLVLPGDCTREQTQKLFVVADDEHGGVAKYEITRHDEGLSGRLEESGSGPEKFLHDRLYVIFWYATRALAPRTPMPAAIISGPSDESLVKGEMVYQFESLAYVEVLEKTVEGHLQETVDPVVQLIRKKWTLG
ncbi:Heterokaryon incompatibility [Penicillium italicum]|uniref:Heterokaryon incompatibility n=1 Tax=Penicillium italicum TaxID=40296 RepID=A0A0A2KKV5_PENIT|nr:Heterokaryon incompatibility [Penicillium italicum]